MKKIETIVTETITCDICGAEMKDFCAIQVIRPIKVVRIVYESFFTDKVTTIEDICSNCNSKIMEVWTKLDRK